MNKTEKVMVILADTINGILSKYFKNVGFAVLVFAFNDSNEVNYISNAKRSSIIQAFKDAIIELENDEPGKKITLKGVIDDNEKSTEKTKKT